MFEKKHSLHLKNMGCKIFDPASNELLTVKMMGKNFPLLLEKSYEHAYTSELDESKL